MRELAAIIRVRDRDQRATLENIERTMRPQAALPLVARVSGTVVAEQGERQQMIEPRQLELFTVTDPTRYCIYVEVPDADAPRVLVGTTAQLTVEGLPRPITAKVAHVFRRSVDGLRTVRFDVHSPRAQITPEARVSARIPLARSTTSP